MNDEDDVIWKLSLVDDPQNRAVLESLASSVEDTMQGIAGSIERVVDSIRNAGSVIRKNSVVGAAVGVGGGSGSGVSVSKSEVSVDVNAASLSRVGAAIEREIASATSRAIKSSMTEIDSHLKAAGNSRASSLAKAGEEAGKSFTEAVTKSIGADSAAKAASEAGQKAGEAYVDAAQKAIERGKFLRQNLDKATAQELNSLFGDNTELAAQAGWRRSKNTTGFDERRNPWLWGVIGDLKNSSLANAGEESGKSLVSVDAAAKSSSEASRKTGDAAQKAIERGKFLLQNLDKATAQELNRLFGDDTELAAQAGWRRSKNTSGFDERRNPWLWGAIGLDVPVNTLPPITPVNSGPTQIDRIKASFGVGATRYNWPSIDTSSSARSGVMSPVDIRNDPRMKAAMDEYYASFGGGGPPNGPPNGPDDPWTSGRKKLEAQNLNRVNDSVDELTANATRASDAIGEIDKKLNSLHDTSLGNLAKASGKAVHSVATLAKGIAQIAVASEKGGISETMIKNIIKIEGYANTVIGLAKSVDTVGKAGSSFINFFTQAAEKSKLAKDRLALLAESTKAQADALRKFYEASVIAGESQERLLEISKQMREADLAAAEAKNRLADAEARTGSRRGAISAVAASAGGVFKSAFGGDSIFGEIGDRIGDAIETAINKKGTQAYKTLKKTKLGRRAMGGLVRAKRLLKTAGRGGAAGGAAMRTLAGAGARGGLYAAGALGYANIAYAAASGTPLSETALSKYMGSQINWGYRKVGDFSRWAGKPFGMAVNAVTGIDVSGAADYSKMVDRDEKLSDQLMVRNAFAQASLKERVIRRRAEFEGADRQFSIGQRLSQVDDLSIGDKYSRTISESRGEAGRIRAEQMRIYERSQAGLIDKASASRMQADLDRRLSAAQSAGQSGIDSIVAKRTRDLGDQQDAINYARGQISIVDKNIGQSDTFLKSEEGQQELTRKIALQKQIEASLREQIQTIREIESTQKSANDEQIGNLRQQQQEWKRIKESSLDAAKSATQKLGDMALNREGDFERYVEIKKKAQSGKKLEDDELKFLDRNAVDKQDAELLRTAKEDLLRKKLRQAGVTTDLIGSEERSDAANAEARERRAASGVNSLQARNAEITKRADAQISERQNAIKGVMNQQEASEAILISTQVDLQVNLIYKEIEGELRKQLADMNLDEKRQKELKELVTRLFVEYQQKGKQVGRNG